jgi:hypothetical protein
MFEVFVKESDAQSNVLQIIQDTKIKEAILITAGLGSRRFFVAQLVDAGVDTTVYIQHPDTYADKTGSIYSSIGWIASSIEKTSKSRLKVRFHRNHSSLRSVVLTEADTGIQHLFLGWYTHHDKNERIQGSQNPTIYFNSESQFGREMATWFNTYLIKLMEESDDYIIEQKQY